MTPYRPGWGWGQSLAKSLWTHDATFQNLYGF
jgi:hypothetical protein